MTRWLARAANGWSRFWFAPASPYPAAAFRILLGLFLIPYMLRYAPDVDGLFSNQGVYLKYFVPYDAPPPAVAWLLFAALLAVTACVIAGYRAAWTAPAMALLYLHHYFLQIAVCDTSFERLLMFFLVTLCFARSNRVWSLDARAGRAGAAPADAWVGRIVRFQMIIFYFGCGLWKVFNPAWEDGLLLRNGYLGMWSTPMSAALAWTDLSPQTWYVLTRVVAWMEIVLAGLLLVRRTRPLGMVLGLLFHLHNSVILFLPEFMVAVVPYVYFFVPETIRRAGESLRSAFRKRPAA